MLNVLNILNCYYLLHWVQGKAANRHVPAQSSLFCDEIKSITNFLELLEGDNFLSPYFGGERSRRRNRIDQGLAIIIMVHH